MMNEHLTQSELEAKRKVLLERLEKIKKDTAQRLDTDSSERAVELENAEVLNEINRVTREELEKIEELLRLKTS